MADPILITFPPSLDSELSRFLLAHYGARHTERRHTFIFCFFVTLWRGCTLRFPLLYGGSYRLNTVRKMVDRLDPDVAEDRKLLLASPHRAEIESDWSLFNDRLAFASAVFAYYHLLPHRSIMIRPLTEGVPRFEERAVRAAYPVFAGMLRLLLRLTEGRAASALSQAREVFQAVDSRLADGRRFLVGDRFSLSDMAFAVAAAPFVLPDNYGGPLPPFAEMPPVVQSAITEMRSHAAGRHALRIYREFR